VLWPARNAERGRRCGFPLAFFPSTRPLSMIVTLLCTEDISIKAEGTSSLWTPLTTMGCVGAGKHGLHYCHSRAIYLSRSFSPPDDRAFDSRRFPPAHGVDMGDYVFCQTRVLVQYVRLDISVITVRGVSGSVV